jgi:hypothetical protein
VVGFDDYEGILGSREVGFDDYEAAWAVREGLAHITPIIPTGFKTVGLRLTIWGICV